MALVKTAEEIEKMRTGGALLSRALEAAARAVAPGVSLKEIDAIGEKVLIDGGAKPSFKGYQSSPDDIPFPSAVCISVNEEIVHGLGNRDRVLKEGEIVGLDIGCWYEGLCTDMAMTVPVGKVSDEATKLMQVTKEALYTGIKQAVIGNEIADIGVAVEALVKPHGYGIVRALVGHGVGHDVHEPPHIPNFKTNRYPSIKIKEGMCLALEPMLGLGGDYKVDTAPDGWGIVMADGSLGSHFEVTIAITKDGPEILTPQPEL